MAAAAVAMMVSPEQPAEASTSTAAGLLALLEEEEEELRSYALTKLHEVVDQYWAEVSSALPLIEELSEDDTFPSQDLAAAVASKVFFHLEEYNDALRLALSAGEYFDVSSKTEYVGTMVSRCIDEYTALRVKNASAVGEEAVSPIDPRMEAVVERMFERCYSDQEYTQAMGIALESLRLDRVEETLKRAEDAPKLLLYTMNVCQTLVASKQTRDKVLRVLVQQHRLQAKVDHAAVCVCLQFLNEPRLVMEILASILRESQEDALLAYQIAFDLVESENQKFMIDVASALPKKKSKEAATEEPAADAAPAESTGEEGEGGGEKVEAKEESDGAEEESEEFWSRIAKLRLVLVGGFSQDLSLSFMHRACETDLLILKNLKAAVESRYSVLHNATVVTHGFMNAGTTRDGFLRDNLEWMGRANNWAKFTATASIGAVHKGHVKESMNLLQPYLPAGGVSASPFSEGGALYALGLIHANRGNAPAEGGAGAAAAEGGGGGAEGPAAAVAALGAGGAGAAAAGGATDVLPYLSGALRDAGANEAVQHGACLGLGLAAMATHSEELYESMKNTLYSDSAVSGEAAALGIGLVMLGCGTKTPVGEAAVRDMLTYAHDTSHEKIIRGLTLGIALAMYGQEEAADSMIEQLARDRDPILRYGACYTVGLAYCGTGNNKAVRRLLHVAVSDVSDDVRLAAVTNLGFLLFRTPEQVPRLVSLLAESFNAHVRYGSCMAIGISCAGTGSKEALEVLEPMTQDAVDFVRQGAMIAMAMVLIQQSDAGPAASGNGTGGGSNGSGRAVGSKAKAFRAKLASIAKDKHQSTMTKMGAILAAGILDAGGRNVTISMQSRAGFTKMGAVVGMAIFCQYWYWYPLMHFLTLSFTPTMLVGLNKDLKIPESFKVTCSSRPSQFAYPKKLEEKKEEKKERVTTVALSTTAKAKAREARKELAKAKEGGGAVEGGDAPTAGAAAVPAEEGAPAEGGEEAKVEPKKARRKPEPESFTVDNLTRVSPLQEAFILVPDDQRYTPVSSRMGGGVVMLVDKQPEEPDDGCKALEVPGGAEEEEEADPPEPFEWTPPPVAAAASEAASESS